LLIVRVGLWGLGFFFGRGRFWVFEEKGLVFLGFFWCFGCGGGVLQGHMGFCFETVGFKRGGWWGGGVLIFSGGFQKKKLGAPPDERKMGVGKNGGTKGRGKKKKVRKPKPLSILNWRLEGSNSVRQDQRQKMGDGK